MTKALYKVQKQISKKKGKLNSLHENSRDSKRLRRAGAREDKLAKLAATTSKANQSYVQRIAFFQDALHGATGPFSEKHMHELVVRYITRDDGERARLKAERRKGRPQSSREDLLERRADAEDKEYQAGFWMPGMEDMENLKMLERWNGEWASLSTFKYIRLPRSGVRQTSTFPPKGLS